MFQIANLEKSITGVSQGFIRIFSFQGKCCKPIIKYYYDLHYEKYFSMNISSFEIKKDNIKKEHYIIDKIRKQVKEFVEINQEVLLDFWQNGIYWELDKFNRFIDVLIPIDRHSRDPGYPNYLEHRTLKENLSNIDSGGFLVLVIKKDKILGTFDNLDDASSLASENAESVIIIHNSNIDCYL